MNSRVIYFKYKLYDVDGAFKKDLYNVIDARVSYNSLTKLKSSAVITLEEDKDIDFLHDSISIICVIDDEEYPLGNFLISSPRRIQDGMNVIRECECYSKILILEQEKLESRLVIGAGANIVGEVKRLIGNNHNFNIQESQLTTSSVREWEIGTPKIDIINDLLSSINYTSLRIDGEGTFVATEYILPNDREVEIEYLDKEDISIIYNEVAEEIDVFDIPNVFIRYTNNFDIYPPLVAKYENNNISSETSIIKMKRRVTDAKEVSDVADIDTLYAICKRDAYNISDKYQIVEFETAINPIHSYMNCIKLDCYDLLGKYIETSWEITSCSVAGNMKHRVRRVINI